MTDEAREELRDLRLLCRSQEILIHRLKGEIKILEKELEEK